MNSRDPSKFVTAADAEKYLAVSGCLATAYTVPFCSECGSPVPAPSDEFDDMEIPAGLLNGDPGIKPDKHIFVEYLPAWDSITDGLPTFTMSQIHKHRTGK